jgi:glycosyltransferase involved in cell wall biosynthesis
MKIGLIAPPFIEIPPRRYGGTELFIANLARSLDARGHEVTVYGNGDSRVPCRLKWRYPSADWPIEDSVRAQLKNADHTGWAVRDAAEFVDVIHLNDIVGAPFTSFVGVPTVLTVHHPHEPALSEQYLRYPDVHYVLIAEWLAQRELMPRMHVIHHGIPTADYEFSAQKDDYVAFLGRMAPCKGPHLAIEAARRAGIRLKLAGEIQPIFRDYWQELVLPLIDGRQIEYVGEADLAAKNALLTKARALLFPIQWEEPFGLVMIEAMACGTPVLALAGGSVEEIVRDGVNGWICHDVGEMAARMASSGIQASACRDFVDQHFSLATMADRYLEVYDRALTRTPAAPAELEA